MARNMNVEFVKTYASAANAEKAVAKVLGEDHAADRSDNVLHYIIVPVVKDTAIRYGVLFIGMSAVAAGMRFNFNCVA